MPLPIIVKLIVYAPAAKSPMEISLAIPIKHVLPNMSMMVTDEYPSEVLMCIMSLVGFG